MGSAARRLPEEQPKTRKRKPRKPAPPPGLPFDDFARQIAGRIPPELREREWLVVEWLDDRQDFDAGFAIVAQGWGEDPVRDLIFSDLRLELHARGFRKVADATWRGSFLPWSTRHVAMFEGGDAHVRAFCEAFLRDELARYQAGRGRGHLRIVR